MPREELTTGSTACFAAPLQVARRLAEGCNVPSHRRKLCDGYCRASRRCVRGAASCRARPRHEDAVEAGGGGARRHQQEPRSRSGSAQTSQATQPEDPRRSLRGRKRTRAEGSLEARSTARVLVVPRRVLHSPSASLAVRGIPVRVSRGVAWPRKRLDAGPGRARAPPTRSSDLAPSRSRGPSRRRRADEGLCRAPVDSCRLSISLSPRPSVASSPRAPVPVPLASRRADARSSASSSPAPAPVALFAPSLPTSQATLCPRSGASSSSSATARAERRVCSSSSPRAPSPRSVSFPGALPRSLALLHGRASPLRRGTALRVARKDPSPRPRGKRGGVGVSDCRCPRWGTPLTHLCTAHRSTSRPSSRTSASLASAPLWSLN